jgi:hypothetical protein
MTLLFFLKPHYKQPTGLRLPPSKPKKKKKRVYKVEVVDKQIEATPVDYEDFAVSLKDEVRKITVKKQKKRSRTAFALLQFMLEDDE